VREPLSGAILAGCDSFNSVMVYVLSRNIGTSGGNGTGSASSGKLVQAQLLGAAAWSREQQRAGMEHRHALAVVHTLL